MSADIRGLTVLDGVTDTSIIHRDCYLCLSDRELSLRKQGLISQRLRGPVSTSLYTHFNFLLEWMFRILVRVCSWLMIAPRNSVRRHGLHFFGYPIMQFPEITAQLSGYRDNDLVAVKAPGRQSFVAAV